MIRSNISKSGLRGLLGVALLVGSAGAAMAQVEHPSQITVQGTALIQKDSNADAGSNSATKSGGVLVGYSYQFNSWAGAEGNYGLSRNSQNFLGTFGQSSIQS